MQCHICSTGVFFIVFTALLPNDVFYYFHFSGSKIQIQPPLSCDVQIFHVCPLPQCATGWNSQRNWFQTILSFINGLGSTSTASQWSVSGKTTKDQIALEKKTCEKSPQQLTTSNRIYWVVTGPWVSLFHNSFLGNFFQSENIPSVPLMDWTPRPAPLIAHFLCWWKWMCTFPLAK